MAEGWIDPVWRHIEFNAHKNTFLMQLVGGVNSGRLTREQAVLSVVLRYLEEGPRD